MIPSFFKPSRLNVLAAFALALTSTSQAILDTNANGLSDVWEKQYNASELFLSSNPIHAATADPDQDGWTNAQEALAGTDPFDASIPAGKTNLTITPAAQAATYELTWPTMPGKSYRLQVSSNLTTWVNVGAMLDNYYDESQLTLAVQTIDPSAPSSASPRLFWRIKVYDNDADNDSLTDSEELITGTYPWSLDSDEDGLPDHWELSHNMSPIDYVNRETENDPDMDGLTNREEYLLGFNPLQYDPNAQTLDRDNDAMPDLFEARTALYFFDYTIYQYTYKRKLNWEVFDSHLDFDKDQLSNLVEYQLTTDPVYWDTDEDMLPDQWEITNSLNAKSDAGNHGTQGDLDGDGLSNIDELTHGTRADLKHTDGDGATDKEEVDRGSNPNNASDNGQAPEAWQFIDVPFTIGDPSGSTSEIWKMIIQGTGPEDTRKFEIVSPNYGQMAQKLLKLRKWNRYTVTIDHVGTDKNEAKPDYDWEAQVDAKPTSVSEEETPTAGENNFFTVKDHWLVDNRQAVFTKEKHGDDDNIVSGKVARLIPIVIHDVGNKAKLTPTGTDDVSVTADPASVGYKPDFWIMAPQGGGANDKNEMYFQIPMTPGTDLAFASNIATPTPANITLHGNPWQTENPIVTWRGSGTQTTDERPTFQIGIHKKDIQLPIQVKSMKKRMVKVAIYPIRHNHANRNVPTPNEALLEQWLNLTYGDQINTYFDITYMPQTDHNYVSSDGFSYREPTFESMLDTPTYTNDDYDIRIILIDLTKLDASYIPNFPNVKLLGTSSIDQRAAIVLAGSEDLTTPLLTERSVIDTITHEIGHVMLGKGHPDQNEGVAPLKGVDLTYRLMHSTPVVEGARLLVKAEWDEAEVWLKKFVD